MSGLLHKNTEIIFGCPGAGKTTTLLGMVEKELQEGTQPEKIGYLSFTKRAAEEAISRAAEKFNLSRKRFPYFRTLHSLCFRAMGLSSAEVLEGKRLEDFGNLVGYKITGRFSLDEGTTFGFEKGDRLLFMEHLARAREVPLEEVYNEDDDGLSLWEVRRFADALAAYKQDLGVIDFTDMLKSFVNSDVVVDLDVLFVDEAQDLSKLQWDVVRKLAKTARKVIVAGDDDQCQPSGNKVLVSGGELVDIADLDPTKHKVVVFDAGSSGFYGLRRANGGKEFQKAQRHYTGTLIHVNGSTCTVNHRWPVRWNKDAPRHLCVYLMRKGDRWRLGTSYVQRDGSSTVSNRLRGEDADALWVLKTFPEERQEYRRKGSSEVEHYERLMSMKYGIPTCVYSLLPEDKAEQLWNVSPQRWLDCLMDHGCDPIRPFHSREMVGTRRWGSLTFHVEAVNIIPGLMCVMNMNREWVPAEVHRQEDWQGIVYSLNVEKYHNYVSNGFLTDNCLYRWSGADVETLINMPGRVRVLEQSWRVPRAVQAVAANVVDRIRNRRPKVWHPRADDGLVKYHTSWASVDFSGPDILVLARNRYILREFESSLKAMGYLYEFQGVRSIRPKVLDAVLTWERLRQGKPGVTAQAVRKMYEMMSVGTSVKRGFKTLPGPADDQEVDMTYLVEHGGLLADTTALWYDALDKMSMVDIAYIRAARRRGENLLASPRIRLSTIHGMKGGEADQVVLMTDMAARTYEEYRKNPEDEARVWYVAVTRARKELHIIAPKTTRNYIL